MDGASLPLHVRRVLWKNLIINRLHMLLNGAAILAVFYYRATTLSRIIETREIPILPYVIVIICETFLTLLWIILQGYRWRPVKRSVFPERLPGDERLPPVDVFICTADPSKEPSLNVMNTVISAMSLDYPPEKLAVYLSDDGGSHVTLSAVRESWKFARFWVPFCRKYELKIRCPQAYFAAEESAHEKFIGSSEFAADKKLIKSKYGEFQEALEKNSVNASGSVSRDHPPTIEVMTDENTDSNLKEMPLLVYMAREKRPGHPHHFKGGALNTLLKVSAVISNAPYFLVLDCDMYCYDPSSARQAMCFYLDPKLSPQIGWVQYPQKYRDVSERDIYCGRLNKIWREGLGCDGLRGPNIYGCNFFMKREAIYGSDKIKKDTDLNELKKRFGASNEFIKSIIGNYKSQLPENRKPTVPLEKELQLVASCTYEDETEWGQEVGYRTFTVVEDTMTSIVLHCEGWISVFLDPDTPCFLGASPTNLNDLLVQQTRWSMGLMQIGFSKYSPLIYGPPRMSILQSLCYGAVILYSLSTIPFLGLAIIPQICLLYGIPLYPKVSDPFFIAFAYIFVASQLKHVEEVLSYGDSVMDALYELRGYMIMMGSSSFYGVLNAILYKLGLHQADFTLTNKMVDPEQARRLQEGIYDFQASPLLIGQLCSLYIINLVAFIVGFARVFQKGDEFLAQAIIPLFGIAVNYYLFEGMVLRKDNGRVPPSTSLLAVAMSAAILLCGSLFLLY